MRPSTPRAVAIAIAAALLHVMLPVRAYVADWGPDGYWAGPEFWSTPQYDWQVSGGSIRAPAAVNRTLSSLSCMLSTPGASAELSVTLSFSGPALSRTQSLPDRFAAGFSIARNGYVSDYRSTAVLARSDVRATVARDGRLRIANAVSAASLNLADGPVRLTLNVARVPAQPARARLTLTAVQAARSVSVQTTLAVTQVLGGVALLTDGEIKRGAQQAAAYVTFNRFVVEGSMVKCDPSRTFGPILWTQYMMSDGRLRIQAQLAPLDQRYPVALYLKSDYGWAFAQKTRLDALSRTATFKFFKWDSARPRQYQVRLRYGGKMYQWGGTIRAEPTASKFKLAVFSCDEGYTFPMKKVVAQVKRQDPDMLAFVGDQIYDEPAGFDPQSNLDPTRFASVKVAMLDYLHKWNRFGWTWRNLLKDIPVILMPDDHDVYQGNLFGAGGIRLPNRTEERWPLGGYIMPGAWVSAIERTHTGHLPQPAADITLPIGIKPYFTDVRYGGIGFAVLEDRKFKTGPFMLDTASRATGKGGELLGPAQERFVSEWCAGWANVSMKVALSATIFSKATTHTGLELRRAKYNFDSGAWPLAARNRAVRMLADANVLTLHGDQHLGVLLRQGIDDFDDAGYSFMVPGIANGFPRAWWPGVDSRPVGGEDFTGKFVDDAGHPINVLAVGNPDGSSTGLDWWTSHPNEVAYRKGSGYGLVVLDKSDKSAVLNLYRVGRGEEQFKGFPYSIRLGGKPS